MSSEPAATSTASEIAIPRLPELCSACERPASVRSEGLRWTVPPQVSIIALRYGFWSYEMPTMKTSHSSPKSWQARDSADPHCPAPVSVESFRIPASRL